MSRSILFPVTALGVLLASAALPACRTASESGILLSWEPAPGARATPESQARLVEVVQQRLEQLELKDVQVKPSPLQGIRLFLPGGRHITEVKQALSFCGRLELRKVLDGATRFLPLVRDQLPAGVELRDQPAGQQVAYTLTAAREADLRQACAGLANLVPQGAELMIGPGPNAGEWVSYLVERTPSLTGELVESASPLLDSSPVAQPAVSVTLTAEGARRFETLTGELVEQRLAIVTDGVVRTAPVVKERIAGGRLQITMGGGDSGSMAAEAHRLAAALRSGELPYPLVLTTEESSAGSGRSGR